MTLLAAVTEILERNSIRHALIGAGALALHGVSRSTADVDLFALDERCLHADTWTSLAPLRPEIRAGDADDPLRGVIRFESGSEPALDLVVGWGAAWQEGILERATTLGFEGIQVRVATPGDLILLKLYAGGPQDAWDVAQLLSVPHRQELEREVDARLDTLPGRCRRFWERILATPAAGD